jgi:hypothetical protein
MSEYVELKRSDPNQRLIAFPSQYHDGDIPNDKILIVTQSKPFQMLIDNLSDYTFLRSESLARGHNPDGKLTESQHRQLSRKINSTERFFFVNQFNGQPFVAYPGRLPSETSEKHLFFGKTIGNDDNFKLGFSTIADYSFLKGSILLCPYSSSNKLPREEFELLTGWINERLANLGDPPLEELVKLYGPHSMRG